MRKQSLDADEFSFVSLEQKDLIVLRDVQRVLAVDALTSSHPLSSDEDDIMLPEQISEQFDLISYSKVEAEDDPEAGAPSTAVA